MSLSLVTSQIPITIPRARDATIEATLDHDGAAPDISADTVTFRVTDGLGGAVVFEVANGPGEHTTPAAGVTTFDLPAALTAGASADTNTIWRYEVSRTASGGGQDLPPYAWGPFIVVPTI